MPNGPSALHLPTGALLLLAVGLALVGAQATGLLTQAWLGPVASRTPTQLLLSLGLAQLLSFGLPAVALLRLTPHWPGWGLSRHRPWVAMAVAAGTMAAALPLVNALVLPQATFDVLGPEVAKALRDLAAQNKQLVERLVQAPFALQLVMVAVVPAVAEELFFRGVVLGGLRRSLPLWAALVISGLIFSLLHLEPTAFLVRWLLGVGLGLLLVGTGSVWPAVAAHALNNTLSLTLARLQAQGLLTEGQLDEAGIPQAPTTLAVLLAVASVGLVAGGRWLWRYHRQHVQDLPA